MGMERSAGRVSRAERELSVFWFLEQCFDIATVTGMVLSHLWEHSVVIFM